MRDDVSDTWFDPAGAVPDLVDANPSAYSEDEIARAIETFLADTLLPMLESSRQREQLAYEYRRLGIVYQLDVVSPSGPRSWQIDFGGTMALVDGPSPNTHIRARIAASMLVDLIKGDAGASYVYSVAAIATRTACMPAGHMGCTCGSRQGEPAVVDPLWIAFDLEDLFKRYVDREIATYGTAVVEPT